MTNDDPRRILAAAHRRLQSTILTGAKLADVGPAAAAIVRRTLEQIERDVQGDLESWGGPGPVSLR
jgi:hypothetical protein